MVAGGCSQSRNVCNKMFYLNTITRYFFRIPYGTIPKNLNFPHANKKLCRWQCENTMIPLFHNVEIRIKRSQETFLGFPVVPSRRTRIFPMQTWNFLFDNGKIQWFLLFHNVKIRIKHWNIGPTIPLEIFPYVFFIQPWFIRGFYSFPYRECQEQIFALSQNALSHNDCNSIRCMSFKIFV
jgi:hypothetical protein